MRSGARCAGEGRGESGCRNATCSARPAMPRYALHVTWLYICEYMSVRLPVPTSATENSSTVTSTLTRVDKRHSKLKNCLISDYGDLG